MPVLDFTGSPLVGNPFTLRLRNALPGATAAVLLSTTSVPTPLPFFGATLHPSAPFLASVALPVGPDGSASGVLDLDPVSASACGFEFFSQAGVLDPASLGGLAVTGGRHIRFGARDDAPLFGRTKHPTGSRPRDVEVADLDGDGRLDLVVADLGSQASNPTFASEVRVLLGTDGGFVPHQTLSTGGRSATTLAVADLDGNGVLDLAVANAGSNDLGVLLGNGDGTFGPATIFPAGNNPESVVASDFDGDGDLDLAFANASTDDVSVLLGNGDGTFGARTSFGAGSQSLGIGVADFDDDGADDLVVTHMVGTISVLLGNGDGTFGAPAGYPAGWQPWTVSIADLDRDGFEDLVVPNALSNDVSVLLGNGDGTFGPASNLAVGEAPFSVAIDDFDGDGHRDLAVANVAGAASTSGSISLLPGNGDGTFGAVTHLPGPGRFQSVAAADVDNDGSPDLIAADMAEDQVPFRQNSTWVLRNAGDGTFGAAPVPAGSDPRSITIGDFDADGIADLAVANRSSRDVTVHPGLGAGSFAAATSYSAGASPSAVATDDLNGDGALDLVVTDAAAAGTGTAGTVLLGAGDGTFANGIPFTAGSGPSDVAIADLDGDGDRDLVVSNGASDDLSVLPGNGDGTFGSPTSHGVGLLPNSVAIADLDGDGALDLATSNIGSSSVSVLMGSGNGGFSAATTFSTGRSSWPSSLTFADLDDDGSPDLILSRSWYEEVEVRLGLGDGTFAPATRYPCRRQPRFLTTADLDGDGHLDVATANDAGDDVAIFLGLGDGTLQRPSFHAAGDSPTSLAASDLDGDGVADLAVTSELSDDVWVLRNRLLR